MAIYRNPDNPTEFYDDASGETFTMPNAMGAFGQEFGRELGSMRSGAEQLYSLATGFASPEGRQQREAISQREAAAEARMEPVREEYPTATFLGGMTPYMLAPTLPGGPAGRVATGLIAGALPYDESNLGRLISAGGGAAGGLLGSAVNLQRQGGSRIAQRSEELGFKRSPGEIYDSEGLKRFEASLESFPPTAGAVSARRLANQKLSNQIALGSIGETGQTIPGEVLDAGAQRIGDVFEEVAEGVSFQLDDAFIDRLAAIEDEAVGSWIKSDPISKVLDKAIEEAASGPMTGERYLRLSSRLGNKVRSMFKSKDADPNDAFMLAEIKNALDDQFEKAVPQENLYRLREARKQWNNLMSLESGTVVNPGTGDVSGPLLSGVLGRKDKVGYKRGRNQSDLYDMARISKAYPRMADSGTATRSFMQWAFSGNPSTMPLKATMGLLANPAARLYMNSPELLESQARKLPMAIGVQGEGLLQ